MESKNYLSPKEIAEFTVESGIKKTLLTPLKMIILGFLAGAFIAFAAEGSNMAAFGLWANPSTYGLGKALAGAIFGTGLMLVIIAGGELFTGNTLIVMAVLQKKAKLSGMLKNWFYVYLGNFIGSIFISYMIVNSGQLNASHALLAVTTIKIASYKVSLSFSHAFFLGLMCNWLVCLAVWMAYGAKDMVGKIMAIFFPIWLFITSGFEHSVANMYYISAGILAKGNPVYLEAAKNAGVSIEKLNSLNWTTFVTKNLVPVTIGNIVGGGLLVAGVYWFVYLKKDEKNDIKSENISRIKKSV
ncbi:formate/nitrite transporter family protein [Helicovermis profundi]|uniref:Formate/nitrite transporter family protein n=1 Tax=Helicovermis profundi TaxID=3065157 RepID=A0AAU9EAG3_9FIRM|nr:formate/nitrite transporter family protein [Clostridia bacterium S502]